MKNFIKKFLSKDVFVQKYDNLKNIFELMFKKGKYIESQNIKNILKEHIIPLDEKYFMKFNKNKFIIFEKSLELNLKKYKFNNKFEKLMNFGIDQIKIKTNENITKRLSLYMTSFSSYFPYNNKKTFIYEVTIENLCDFKIKEILALDGYKNLFVLSKDKNLVSDEVRLVLYDESFKSQKLVTYLENGIREFLKIDSNTFIYSLGEDSNIKIFLVKIDKIIYHIQILNCGNKLVYFSEKKNIISQINYRKNPQIGKYIKYLYNL